jgi:hypothetical protein
MAEGLEVPSGWVDAQHGNVSAWLLVNEMNLHRRAFARDGVFARRMKVELRQLPRRRLDLQRAALGDVYLDGVMVVPDG